MVEINNSWYSSQCEKSRNHNSTHSENSRQATFSQTVNEEKDSPFGQRLREAFKGVSNTVIFNKLKDKFKLKSKSAITAYMQGRIPNADKLMVISQITNCNLHWLITGEGSNRVIERMEEPLENPYNLTESQIIYIERIANFEGVRFEDVVRELIYSGLDAKSSELARVYRSMPREQLEDVLDAVFSNLPKDNNNKTKKRA